MHVECVPYDVLLFCWEAVSLPLLLKEGGQVYNDSDTVQITLSTAFFNRVRCYCLTAKSKSCSATAAERSGVLPHGHTICGCWQYSERRQTLTVCKFRALQRLTLPREALAPN